LQHVIAAGDEIVYKYVTSWYAAIIQNPTFKSQVMLIIQGKQGSGKTLFTNILCHLLGDYALPNIKDPQNITGHFNAIIESKKLIILNELVSCDDNNAHIEYNNFKTTITEEDLEITQKGRDPRMTQNIINLIITTNYINCLRFSGDDRRICPIITNNKYARGNDDDPEFRAIEARREAYFDPIYEEVECRVFYPTLYTYFMNYDITGFKPRKFPITQARADIVEANKSPVEIFVEENIAAFQEGFICETAYATYRDLCATNGNRGVYSKQKFLGEMKRWCDRKRTGGRGEQHYRLYLNEEGTKHFRRAIEEYAEDNADAV
jgi:phage/plasmid-associated DNA primase